MIHVKKIRGASKKEAKQEQLLQVSTVMEDVTEEKIENAPKRMLLNVGLTINGDNLTVPELEKRVLESYRRNSS